MNADLLHEKINNESIFLTLFFLVFNFINFLFCFRQFFIESICGKQFFIVLRNFMFNTFLYEIISFYSSYTNSYPRTHS